MDVDEKSILLYLKSYPGQFVSGREINRRAGGKRRFRDNPNWATPILAGLVEKRLVESDSTGHYCLVKRTEKKPKKWIAPHIRQILKDSGRQFEEVHELEETDELE